MSDRSPRNVYRRAQRYQLSIESSLPEPVRSLPWLFLGVVFVLALMIGLAVWLLAPGPLPLPLD